MAEIYGTLADALTYHQARGNAEWTAAGADDAKRTAALVRGSQALDAFYSERYPGVIASADQDLLWPRKNVTWRGRLLADYAVPKPVEYAAYELALRELVKPGSLAPDAAAGPQKVLTRIDKIQWEVVGNATTRAVLPIVDGILAEILAPAATGTTVTTLVRF